MKKLTAIVVAMVAALSLASGDVLAQRGGGGGGGRGGGGGWQGHGSGGGWQGSPGWHGGGSGWRGSNPGWGHPGGSWQGGWHGGPGWGRPGVAWRGGAWGPWWGTRTWWGPGWGWWGPGWNWWGPNVGVVIGAPWYWGWAGPVWSPSAIDTPVVPQTFIERPAESQPSSGLWYFCSDPQGYYPYVQSCNRPWQSVTPMPPSGSAPQQ